MDFKILPKIECPKCHEEFRPLQFMKAIQLRSAVKRNAIKGNSDKNKKLVNDGKICAICGEPLEIKWTIRHGEGFCMVCGAPYSLYGDSSDGKRVKELHCGIKEPLRCAFRSIYKTHGNELEKYSQLDEPVGMSSSSKNNITLTSVKETEVSSENIDIPKELSAAELIKAISHIEGRDLNSQDEKIEILRGKGVLVHQSLSAIKLVDPIYYSFDSLKKTVASLQK